MDRVDNFGFEIDFLPVGEKSKSGDAICARWGYDLTTDNPKQTVMVVDGGFLSDKTGDAIVSHVQAYYKSSSIDLLVNTHPHADHIGGLETVLDSLRVKNLVIHKPWEHSDLTSYFNDGRVTAKGVKDSLREGLESAWRLVKKATERSVHVCEPYAPSAWPMFSGVTMDVLGPTKEYYNSLIPQFTVTPTEGGSTKGRRLRFVDSLIDERHGRLTDEGLTSAENNSGAILSLSLPNGKLVLLTGDAGMPALERAAREAIRKGIDIKNHVAFFQVPHHGSAQNVGPMVLDAILGNVSESRLRARGVAYISVSKQSDKEHPAKCVTNALHVRNVSPVQTKGLVKWWWSGVVPGRPGWVGVSTIPFYNEVEQFV